MNKKWIIYIIIAVLISALIGFLVYTFLTDDNEKLQGTDMISKRELAEDNNQINNLMDNVIETSVQEESISPNAIIIKKEYFKACDHLVRTVEDIPEILVNGTKENIEEEYPGWKIEKFSPSEIILYKERQGNCNEHYVVKNHYGVIGIYVINADGREIFKEDTEISTKYLPESDIELLNEGVKIIGKTKLIEFLEDYE